MPPTTLRLKGPVRVSHAVNPDDVVSVKRALADLDLYDMAGMAPNGLLDHRLLGGVEAFQRTHGLAVDRVVNPGGETEQKMNEALHKASKPVQQARPMRATRAHGQSDLRAPQEGRPMLQPVQQAGGTPVQPPAFDPRPGQRQGSDQTVPTPPTPPAFAPDRAPMPRPAFAPTRTQQPEGLPDRRAWNSDPAYGALSPEQGRMFDYTQVYNVPLPDYANNDVWRDWPEWNELLSRRPDIGDVERGVIRELFASEGAFEFNKIAGGRDGTTFAGISATAFQELAAAAGIDPTAEIDMLPRSKILELYHQCLEVKVMGQAGGTTALEAMSDVPAAVLLVDTLFLYGPTGGADILRRAINSVRSEPVLEEGVMKRETFRAYEELMRSEVIRDRLCQAIARERNVVAQRYPDQQEGMEARTARVTAC